MCDLLVRETITIIPTVIASAIGVIASWFLGQRIVFGWQARQKRKEMQLAAGGEFYAAYGEFFQIWKVWNFRLRSKALDPEGDLFARAAAMEGHVEAILVRVASERRLSPEDLDNLGMLRQAFQELRQEIREGRALRWDFSNHPQYVQLKKLAAYAGSLFGDELWDKPTAEEAQAAVVAITSNRHEERWRSLQEAEVTAE